MRPESLYATHPGGHGHIGGVVGGNRFWGQKSEAPYRRMPCPVCPPWGLALIGQGKGWDASRPLPLDQTLRRVDAAHDGTISQTKGGPASVRGPPRAPPVQPEQRRACTFVAAWPSPLLPAIWLAVRPSQPHAFPILLGSRRAASVSHSEGPA